MRLFIANMYAFYIKTLFCKQDIQQIFQCMEKLKTRMEISIEVIHKENKPNILSILKFEFKRYKHTHGVVNPV